MYHSKSEKIDHHTCPVMFATLTTQFLTSCQARNLSAGTITAYRYHLASYATTVDGQPWNDAATIERFLAGRRAAGLSPATVNGDHRILKIFFDWCVKRPSVDLTVNPMADIQPPRIPQRRQKTATVEEVGLLFDSIPHGDWYDVRDRLMINILFFSGIRVGDLCKLRLQDMDVAAGYIIVQKGKGGGFRHVPMLRPIAESFIEYRFVRPDVETDWLFVTSSNNRKPQPAPITTAGIRQRLTFLCDRAGCRRLNPHAFRHGLAVHLLNDKGADMSLIQQILGHRNITTTAQTYALWEVDGLASEFERIMSD